MRGEAPLSGTRRSAMRRQVSLWRPLPLLLTLAAVLLTGRNHINAESCDPDADATYMAAVLEYSPALGVTLENVKERFRENVLNYVAYAKEAKRQGAEIVVFPECGLATLELPRLPDSSPAVALALPPVGTNPCIETDVHHSQELRDLSCAARDSAIYIVVNLPEEERCFPTMAFCPECPGFDLRAVRSGIVACNMDGKRYFNTDIAFDRKGAIVARYRKYNLFGEAGFVPPAEPSLDYFDADFSVRFGLFTCFDLMFEQPAVMLVTEAGVTDVVFPTAWFSELPFLTAVQAQASWAWVLDVNFLGAGYNLPEVGSTGTGLYAGRRGKVVATMARERANKLLVGRLPNRNACSYNASAATQLAGRIVELARQADPPVAKPAAPPPTPECADALAATDVDIPSLYQCHLQSLLALKDGRRLINPETGEEAEEAPEGIKYELHYLRHDDDDEAEVRADEEEFKEVVEPKHKGQAGLIYGHRYRQYVQDVMMGQLRRLQDKSDPMAADGDAELENKEEVFHHLQEEVEGDNVQKVPNSTLHDAVEDTPEQSNINVADHEQETLQYELEEMQNRREEERQREEEGQIKEEIASSIKKPEYGLSKEKKGNEPSETHEFAEYEDAVAKKVSQYKVSEFVRTKEEEILEGVTGTDERQGKIQEEYHSVKSDSPPLCSCEGRGGTKTPEDPAAAASAAAAAAAAAAPKGGPARRSTLVGEDDGYLYLKTEDLSNYATVLLPAEAPPPDVHENSSVKVCHEGFCCHFQVVLTAIDLGSAPAELANDRSNDPQNQPGDVGFSSEGNYGETEVSLENVPETVSRSLVKSAKRPPLGGQFAKNFLPIEDYADDDDDDDDDDDLDDEDDVLDPEDMEPTNDEYDDDEEVRMDKSAELSIDHVLLKASGIGKWSDANPGADETVALEDMEPSAEAIRAQELADKKEELGGMRLDMEPSRALVEAEEELKRAQKPEVPPPPPPPRNAEVIEEPETAEEPEVTVGRAASSKTPSEAQRYYYRLAVFNGRRTFDGITDGGLQVCAVIPCTDTSAASCGKLHASPPALAPTVFRHVRIAGRFARVRSLPLPSTLDGDLMPLPADAFSLSATVRRKETDIVMKTHKPVSFLTFGIYNRNFGNDPERNKPCV